MLPHFRYCIAASSLVRMQSRPLLEFMVQVGTDDFHAVNHASAAVYKIVPCVTCDGFMLPSKIIKGPGKANDGTDSASEPEPINKATNKSTGGREEQK